MVKNIHATVDDDVHERLKSVKDTHGMTWEGMLVHAADVLAGAEPESPPDTETPADELDDPVHAPVKDGDQTAIEFAEKMFGHFGEVSEDKYYKSMLRGGEMSREQAEAVLEELIARGDVTRPEEGMLAYPSAAPEDDEEIVLEEEEEEDPDPPIDEAEALFVEYLDGFEIHLEGEGGYYDLMATEFGIEAEEDAEAALEYHVADRGTVICPGGDTAKWIGD